jgi:hypothetical protein
MFILSISIFNVVINIGPKAIDNIGVNEIDAVTPSQVSSYKKHSYLLIIFFPLKEKVSEMFKKKR